MFSEVNGRVQSGSPVIGKRYLFAIKEFSIQGGCMSRLGLLRIFLILSFLSSSNTSQCSCPIVTAANLK